MVFGNPNVLALESPGHLVRKVLAVQVVALGDHAIHIVICEVLPFLLHNIARITIARTDTDKIRS